MRSYVKEHLKIVLAGGFAVAILYAVAGLYGYGQSMKNMSYALVLIAFFGVCAGAWDFLRYMKKCRELLNALEKEGEREAYLPDSTSLPEQYYQDIICREERELKLVISEYDEKKKDMADYYTMWIHQIKTPIAAMRLLLQSEEEPSKVSRQAMEELFKVEEYANMALHYARLDSLSSDLLFKSYDVYEIAKQAVKKYSILFIGSGLSFSMEEFSCMAVTDEKWLSFVIEQILSNALKYTYSGGIRIYGQDCRGNPASDRAACLVIEDTGIGISESDLPRIFERGFTGYNGRQDKKSTGIGLYLCRQILDRLSHTIEVESRIGKGTKVIIGFVTKM